jgi:hypothetical protein
MLEKLNPGQKPEEEASASARSGKEPEKQEFEKVTGGPLDWLEMLVMMAGGAYGARHFAGKHLKLKGAWAKNMSMAAGALGGFAVSELLLHSVDWLYNKIADHFGYDKDSNQAFGKSAIETVIAIVLSAVVHAKGSAVKLFKIANARNNLGFTLSSNALIRFLAEIPQQIATIFRIGAGLEPNATPLGKLVDMTGRPTENLAKLQHEVENVILADLRDKSPGAWHLSNFATRIAGRAFLDAPSLTRTVENHPTHDPGWHQKLPAMAWDMITKNAAFNLISIPTTLLAFPFLYVTNLISGAFGSLGFGGGDEGEGDGAAEATAA